MVYRFQLTYDEIIDILNLKYFPTKGTGDSLVPAFYEISDIDSMLQHLLPDNEKMSVTIDNIILKSNLKNNKTSIFTKKSFLFNFRFYSITFSSFR